MSQAAAAEEWCCQRRSGRKKTSQAEVGVGSMSQRKKRAVRSVGLSSNSGWLGVIEYEPHDHGWMVTMKWADRTIRSVKEFEPLIFHLTVATRRVRSVRLGDSAKPYGRVGLESKAQSKEFRSKALTDN